MLPSAYEEDGPGCGIALPGPADAFQLQEEEYKRRIELEAEERKLEETLEYQRRIENEAKQKHLAEQHKQISRTTIETAATVAIPDSNLWHSVDGKYANEQWKNRKVSLPFLRLFSPEIIFTLYFVDYLWKKNDFFLVSSSNDSFASRKKRE